MRIQRTQKQRAEKVSGRGGWIFEEGDKQLAQVFSYSVTLDANQRSELGFELPGQEHRSRERFRVNLTAEPFISDTAGDLFFKMKDGRVIKLVESLGAYEPEGSSVGTYTFNGEFVDEP